MAALPFQGQLKVPIEWQGTVMKQTMTAGAYTLSGTVGFRPWKETATLSWTLSVADANALMALLKSGKFNDTYDYWCNTRGAVRIRPTDTFSFQERRESQQITVTVSFETV